MKINHRIAILMCFVLSVVYIPSHSIVNAFVQDRVLTCIKIPMTLSQSKNFAKAYAKQQVKQVGWSAKEWDALLLLWTKESRWDPTADNPKSTAYGIPQILGMPKDTPVTEQVDLGIKYIIHRYQKPSKALYHHNLNGWY